TNAAGCTAHDTMRVSVSDSLQPSVTASGSLVVCAGDSLVLTAADGYATYRWSNGVQTPAIHVTSSGNYFVRVTNSGGCSGTSMPFHVTILPDSMPHPTLQAARTVWCVGDSVELRT